GADRGEALSGIMLRYAEGRMCGSLGSAGSRWSQRCPRDANITISRSNPDGSSSVPTYTPIMSGTFCGLLYSREPQYPPNPFRFPPPLSADLGSSSMSALVRVAPPGITLTDGC